MGKVIQQSSFIDEPFPFPSLPTSTIADKGISKKRKRKTKYLNNEGKPSSQPFPFPSSQPFPFPSSSTTSCLEIGKVIQQSTYIDANVEHVFLIDEDQTFVKSMGFLPNIPLDNLKKCFFIFCSKKHLHKLPAFDILNGFYQNLLIHNLVDFIEVGDLKEETDATLLSIAVGLQRKEGLNLHFISNDKFFEGAANLIDNANWWKSRDVVRDGNLITFLYEKFKFFEPTKLNGGGGRTRTRK